MLGVSTLTLGSSSKMVIQSQAQYATLAASNGKLLAFSGSKRQNLSSRMDSMALPLGLVARPAGPFTTAVAAVDSDQLSSSDPPNKVFLPIFLAILRF